MNNKLQDRIIGYEVLKQHPAEYYRLGYENLQTKKKLGRFYMGAD